MNKQRNLELLHVLQLAANDRLDSDSPPNTKTQLVNIALSYGKSINATETELNAILDSKLIDILLQ